MRNQPGTLTAILLQFHEEGTTRWVTLLVLGTFTASEEDEPIVRLAYDLNAEREKRHEDKMTQGRQEGFTKVSVDDITNGKNEK